MRVLHMRGQVGDRGHVKSLFADLFVGDKKYGWVPKGATSWVSQEFKRQKRWSIPPAYTVNGYLGWIILQGSLTKEKLQRL